jgi:hypothetical protein
MGMALRRIVRPRRLPRRHGTGTLAPSQLSQAQATLLFEFPRRLQAIAMRKALHGWLYVSTVVPDNPRVRAFNEDVRAATERELMINLNQDATDPSAAQLYDAIFLWAHAYTSVLSRQGGRP